MKHTQLIACLIITSIASITFAMERFVELQQQPINHCAVETINAIDEKINKKYAEKFVPDFLKKLRLTTEEKLDILTITNDCCNKSKTELSTQLINDLYEKNTFFEAAIDYFSDIARDNINNVTYATIDTINNPENIQPIPQLNTIPQPIKEYFMKAACKEMSIPYDIPLTHDCAVQIFAIHPKSDTAASYCYGKTLHMWDLKTGTEKKQIVRHPNVDFIQFSYDGSRMAVINNLLTTHLCKKSHIEIINSSTMERIDIIKQNNHVYFVDFMQQQSNNTVATFVFEKNDKYNRHNRLMHLWQLNKQNKYILINSSLPLPWGCEQPIEFLSDKKKYEGNLDEETNKIIQITVKRRAALHLCSQALKNHKDLSLINNITTSQTYQQLTEYEKQLVIQKISQTQKNSSSLSWFHEKKYI